MNPQRIPHAFIFLVLANLLASVQSVCINNGNYTANSTYRANLITALSFLSGNVDINGFYNISVGQNLDRANAAVLCRGDVQLDTCRECVRNATAKLLQSCPNQKQAITWLEFCMLRYSNETIIGKMESYPAYFYWNINNAASPKAFMEDLRKLMDDLRSLAAKGGSLRKVAARNVAAPDFQTIFALVQCTPDLSEEDCNSCLIGAIADIPTCCNRKIGGRVLWPSCNLRFEIESFYKETRLQELAPAPPPTVAPVPVPGPPKKDDGNKTRTVIIIVVSIVASVILAVSLGILFRKRMKHKPNEKHEIGEDAADLSTPVSLQYAFSTVKAATNDFSDNNKLGQGGFGPVYKGTLPNGQEIAVKRLSKDSGQGNFEFKNEVILLVKLQHRNLVSLLGFSLEGTERLLIYEFVQNSSLDKFIFDPIKRTNLDWNNRYKIIRGIARALLYLHEDSRLKIVHRDLKSSNILLDKDMNAKIADFGMARLFGQDETQGSTSRIVGTYGYMSPEYAMHGQFSPKSDVFSFGVLVLEILSGRKNSYTQSEKSTEDLLSFIWKNWSEGTTANVIDPVLKASTDLMRDMLSCIHMGLLCVQENVIDRATMASIVLMLNSHSMTLPLPKEPAFSRNSLYGPKISYGSKESNSTTASKNKAAVSRGSSLNTMTVTELYLR